MKRTLTLSISSHDDNKNDQLLLFLAYSGIEREKERRNWSGSSCFICDIFDNCTIWALLIDKGESCDQDMQFSQ